MHRRSKKQHIIRNLFLLGAGLFLFFVASGILWGAFAKIPDFKSFEARMVARSTKIYDRTGQVLLYDLHQDVKRTVIPLDTMGVPIKNATVAIEDANFYTHAGVRPTSFLRAVFVNLTQGGFSQGGSTITQQIVKNTLLTQEKTVTRKLKEWVLAIKMERMMTKEEILALYLNEVPYGGSVYGIDEASRTYFGKAPIDLSIAEAAYLAAIPQAPTFYSPYGKNRDKLESRKNLVLSRMYELKYITEEEYARAKAEQVVFSPQEATGIRAPHFVFFIKDYLVEKYGEAVVDTGGLKVITTLDYDLQQKAEEILKRRALANEKDYNAENAGLVAIDPKTGQILTMVGSRDYFDKTIDGNYNIATAKRQPGSSFKPFVYATGFNLGYTPDTVLFDVPTEFGAHCSPYGNPLPGAVETDCYMPQNYTGKYYGPMTIRNALAQSINVPAVKMLYLVSIKKAAETARSMGITTLSDPERFGLPLVLGGGEVRLLDMTSAYGVFANTGIRHPATGILRVEDSISGDILEEYTDIAETILPKNTALMVSDILSDNDARTPIFGPRSSLYFSNYQVAVKTGTTNDFKDAWVVGYTPSLVAGAWVGNNDNTPMAKYSSSSLSVPMWHEFMDYALTKVPKETFESPDLSYIGITKPVLIGKWQGGQSFTINKYTGELATDMTPPEALETKVVTDVHDILYWVDKTNPLGAPPVNPSNDPQFNNWETAVRNWWSGNAGAYLLTGIPNGSGNIVPGNKPVISFIEPSSTTVYGAQSLITTRVLATGVYPISKVDYFLNDSYIGSSSSTPFSLSFTPAAVSIHSGANNLKAIAYDSLSNSSTDSITLTLSN